MTENNLKKEGEVKLPASKLAGIKQGQGKGKGGFNLILIILIIGAIALFAWAEQQRRAAQKELQQTITELEELRKASEESGAEVAARVLEKLSKHMTIPADPSPTVATIIDIDKLRESNEFYAVAKNGDHLIITEKRAILYDPDRDVVLDVVPVSINRTSTSSPTPSSAGTRGATDNTSSNETKTTPSAGANDTQ